MKVVLATANPHKADEIRAILGDAVELLPRPPEVPDVAEDADTLEGNARLKAVALCDATALAALADDTGLEVEALHGLPGVRSARYACDAGDSTANVAKLLAELERVGAERPEQRRARFRTVALLRHPDGTEVVADGVVDGVIAQRPLGTGGFGYDPVFVPDVGPSAPAQAEPIGRTFAQMTAAEKNDLSHRGRAFRSLAVELTRNDPTS